MKKVSALPTISSIACGLMLMLLLTQCEKKGQVIAGLDRAYTGSPDSTIYSSFYDNFTIATADAVPDVNDVIKKRGVQTIVKEYCATSNCHAGKTSPTLLTYADISKYVTAGNASTSKLWDYITTNDFNKAMPPVPVAHELPTTDKAVIYNWILNGAKEKPDLNDFRPAAVKILVAGCSSANCHNQATATGAWAFKGLVPGLASADTTRFTYINPVSGAVSTYVQLSNASLRTQVWTAYKDSVKKFFADTVANAKFRPYKTFGTPVTASSVRGPLNNYDDLIMDINYPKSIRSNSSVQYTDASGNKFYVKGSYLTSTDCFMRRMDSTLIYTNPLTGVATSANGSMAYDDGGVSASDVALFKAWYFADPNILDVWKWGNNNAGIFKYKKTGTVITKK